MSAANTQEIEGKVAYEVSETDGVTDEKLRKSNIRFIREQWVYEKIQGIIVQANHDAHWNLNITNMEPLQFAEYADGGYYDWHFDALGAPYGENSKYAGKIRKLSMSVLLNESDEFEGGTFEVHAGFKDNAPVSKAAELNHVGDVIVFPSLVPHRVKPVTKGVRKSLVCWVLGPPFA